MTRRYTTLEELAEAVRTRHEQGETYAEIATSYGIEKKQLRKLMERQRRKKRDESGCRGNHREQPLGLRQTASLPIPHTIQ